MIYSFIDTESTGLGANDKAINFGALITEVENDSKVAKVLCYVDIFNMVTTPITVGAREVHGITERSLKEMSGGATAASVSKDVKTVLDASDCILGFNLSFDMRMLKQTYPTVNINDYDNLYDVMKDVRAAIGKARKLEKLVEEARDDYIRRDFITEFGNDGYVANSHTALFDAYATARLFFELRGYKWILKDTGR